MPGLIEASVWIRVITRSLMVTSRLIAEMRPPVQFANTITGGSSSELPNSAAVSVPSGSTLSTARSVCSSVPMISAGICVPSLSWTITCSASSTTWLLVMM